MNVKRKSFHALTPKQSEALALAAEHKSSKEIARELNISPHSVDKRLDEVRRRLGVDTRREAVRVHHEEIGITTGECSTGDASTVTEPAEASHKPSVDRNDALFTFADAEPYSQPAPWTYSLPVVPKIRPDQIGSVARVGLILLGALAIVILALLLLSIAEGLKTLV